MAAHGRSLQAPGVGASKGRTLPGSRVGSKRHLGLTCPMSTCELGTAHGTAVVVERVPVAFSLFFFFFKNIKGRSWVFNSKLKKKREREDTSTFRAMRHPQHGSALGLTSWHAPKGTPTGTVLVLLGSSSEAACSKGHGGHRVRTTGMCVFSYVWGEKKPKSVASAHSHQKKDSTPSP